MKRNSGFTLVELMLVVGIIAILVALSLPSFSTWARKANRGDAQAMLLNYANNQEVWRSGHATYASSTDIAVPTHTHYNFFVRATGATCANEAPTATQYRLVACAKTGSTQVNDKEKGTTCTPLTLDQTGDKEPAVCWQE